MVSKGGQWRSILEQIRPLGLEHLTVTEIEGSDVEGSQKSMESVQFLRRGEARIHKAFRGENAIEVLTIRDWALISNGRKAVDVGIETILQRWAGDDSM